MLLSEQKKLPKKVVFLDRDGVINRKAKDHHYIIKIEDFVFNKRIFDLLYFFQCLGFEFIIITNQRGIARQIFSVEDLEKIHLYMCQNFKDQGITILDIFYCPHNENECNCRKPKPGLLEIACKKYDIDLKNSFFITDSEKELEMGKGFGINNTFLIPKDRPETLFDILSF